jgi:hypothetical protein
MSAETTAKNYKDTVLLPKTDFPMKADLVTREPQRLAKWQESKLYQRIVAQSKGKPTFILHDGPPFANGDVHMGTAEQGAEGSHREIEDDGGLSHALHSRLGLPRAADRIQSGEIRRRTLAGSNPHAL